MPRKSSTNSEYNITVTTGVTTFLFLVRFYLYDFVGHLNFTSDFVTFFANEASGSYIFCYKYFFSRITLKTVFSQNFISTYKLFKVKCLAKLSFSFALKVIFVQIFKQNL